MSTSSVMFSIAKGKIDFMDQFFGGFSSSLRQDRRVIGTPSREAIGYLKGVLVGRGVVVELCSGTGIITGALLRARVDVAVAVDSRDLALSQLRRSLTVPSIRAAPGTVPLRSGCCDALVINLIDPGDDGIADSERWMSETKRLLRAGGLALSISRLAKPVERMEKQEEALGDERGGPELERVTEERVFEGSRNEMALVIRTLSL